MTPAERESLRLSLLRFLGNNPTSYGISESLLLSLAKAEGRQSLTTADIQDEMVYLADKALVSQVPKRISPELPQWRITAAGRDFLAERGID